MIHCTQRGEADTFYMYSARIEKKAERRVKPNAEKAPGAPRRLENAEGEPPLKPLEFHFSLAVDQASTLSKGETKYFFLP